MTALGVLLSVDQGRSNASSSSPDKLTAAPMPLNSGSSDSMESRKLEGLLSAHIGCAAVRFTGVSCTSAWSLCSLRCCRKSCRVGSTCKGQLLCEAVSMDGDAARTTAPCADAAPAAEMAPCVQQVQENIQQQVCIAWRLSLQKGIVLESEISMSLIAGCSTGPSARPQHATPTLPEPMT